MASNLGSMQFELWNMILINHGCEQQIKKGPFNSPVQWTQKLRLGFCVG